jgi:2-phospho-L-lactate guanylyltransferase (CobY/MobA/RfbA family)
LQRRLSDKLSAEERDVLRADMLRECLKNVSRPVVKKIEPSGLDKSANS